MSEVGARALAAFAAAFGGPPDLVARAPGRVNIIGEHTDYNEGFVLPCAIGRETRVAARRRDDRRIRVVSADYDGAGEFSLDEPFAADVDSPWLDYARGMAVAASADGLPVVGADLAVAGDVPRGAGLSSSASLEVAVGLALCALAGRADVDRARLARVAQRAENTYVGVLCGIMDQLISAAAVAGAATLIDCRTLALAPAPVPDDVSVLIVHSGVARGLVDGHYNARRRECAAAAAALGASSLRDVDAVALESGRPRLADVVFRRARHVVSENARALATAAALKRGDLVEVGRMMAASHASMRDDFEITVPAVDALVAILQQAIGADGGARMTGGGFGGCVVALCRRDRAPSAIDAVRRRYAPPDGSPLLILDERAAAGAGVA